MNRRLALAALLATAALGGVAGCSRGFGLAIGSDGDVNVLNGERVRADMQATLRARAEAAAPGLRAEVAIAELPRLAEDAFGSREWRWEQATVAVTLDRPFDAATAEAVTTAVRRAIRPQVDQAQRTLRIDVQLAAPAPAAAAAAAAPAAAPAPPVAAAAAPAAEAAAAAPATAPAVAPAPPRTYVIQPGDTLAQLSAVFYGSAQHWRRILDANPGLDPAALPVGGVIAVPR